MTTSASNTLPLWRSMLFLPANVKIFIHSAPRRGAAAYILELEDSVPLAQKGQCPGPDSGSGRGHRRLRCRHFGTH